MKTTYRKLEQTIHYRFKKKQLLELALTHPSYRYENATVQDDNQRLEYLGDAVLSLISAEYLFKNNPSAREGEMSKLRSRLTEDRKLAEIADSLDVGSFLQLGNGEAQSGGAKRPSNLADAMEAIIGAAWMDGGARAVHKIFKAVFIPVLHQLEQTATKGNPKGNLQEYAQSTGKNVPIYETIETSGPEHDRRFTVQVSLGEKNWTATERSKREAERMAPKNALKELNPNQKEN
jgi:ribonuclease-3